MKTQVYVWKVDWHAMAQLKVLLISVDFPAGLFSVVHLASAWKGKPDSVGTAGVWSDHIKDLCELLRGEGY